ncbi:MAG: hypothetical protein H0W62_00465 [Chitinophagales bacterium]|nr:hypothetical protein [Chitinophagales bacterium]
MKNLKTMLVLLAMPVILFLGSCTKENQVTPADQAISADDQLRAGELLVGTVSPGLYKITKFVDSGDDKTGTFSGYTFDFQADGDLIATDGNGNVFPGSYHLNSAGTTLTINISGNAALKNLDDDNWNVQKLTNMKIKIRKNGPDVVVFEKI